ncbi:MAG TPA: glycosyltransferase 87 family protein [Mycobacterium sp.]|nr:glycosyltransferase 87 family protein [Mycobacterium sp.]
MDTSRSPDEGKPGGRVGWRLFQVLTAAALGGAAWWALVRWPFHVDIEVYRMGGRAWLDGQPLYSDGAVFATTVGLELPFTYPPLAAIAFAPFAWVSLPVATAIITVTTLVLLVVATTMVLTGLDVWPSSTVAPEPAWLRRGWLAAAIVAPAVLALEPIRSNFSLGQINVVLMALVIADCVPRRTRWPRGSLLGLAIALKLTPAVFVLYFLVRRDTRAVLTTVVSFLAATLLAVVLARQDSWQYWAHTVGDTGRIGGATFNTNQNFAGALARLGLEESQRFGWWLAGAVLVLVLTWYAARRALAAGQPMLALICIALFGLVVSPVSWSHHWVWALPVVIVTAVVGWRQRNIALAVLTVVGVAVLAWAPMIMLLPENYESEAAWWRQLAGLSYVWWALAVIVAVALTARTPARSMPDPARP